MSTKKLPAQAEPSDEEEEVASGYVDVQASDNEEDELDDDEQGVELEFIAHFCAFIRSSIALFKSMPFTWCVLSLPYGPSYCTHPVVFFPIFFPFFSSQKSFAL